MSFLKDTKLHVAALVVYSDPTIIFSERCMECSMEYRDLILTLHGALRVY